MKIDLSVVPAEINYEHTVPSAHLTGRSLYSRYESSSGSYRAFLQDDGKYHMSRMPTFELPGVELGAVVDEQRARRLLDWWVKHDWRMKRVLIQEAWGLETSEDLLDLVVEAAHAC